LLHQYWHVLLHPHNPILFRDDTCYVFVIGLEFLQVVSYAITVPRQRWEFPLLPWGNMLFYKWRAFIF